MGTLFNLARVSTATTGTGTITLGSAVSGYLTFALAGVTDGQIVSYGIKDGANSEVGIGTYTASGTTLTRTVTKSTNSDAAISLSGTAEVYITARSEDFREKLGANRTYYVRTDGSDSNTGLANTSGGAFLTLQKAVDVAFGSLDLGGYNVTIQVADGTYTGGVLINYPQVGAGDIIIQGNNGTPANVLVSVTSADAFSVNGNSILSVRDLKIATTTSGYCLRSNYGGTILFQNVDFGASALGHIRVDDGSTIRATGNYSISAGTAYHLLGVAAYIRMNSITVTLTGTPAFSSAFASAANLGVMSVQLITYSGSATGTRYSAVGNAVIATGGGGASYLPGNAAGSTASGGQYT